MTNVALSWRSAVLRVVLPTLAALTVATASVLPASAQCGNAGQAVPAQAATPADEWWLTALNVPAAWRAAPAEGRGVTVAVLSTGVDSHHRDLAGSVTAGPDFAKTGRTSGDQYWGAEGTAVASLIAGHGRGAGHPAGVGGVAPGARILSIQVTLEYDDPLNSDAAITKRLPAAIAAGIRYAVGQGATVITLPLDPGTLGPAMSGDPAAAGGSQAERTAVSYALAQGVLLVAPAGDNGAGTGTVNYPAAYPGVIAVGATARGGQLSPFTNTGGYVALTAPGSGDTPLLPAADVAATDPAAGLLVAAPNGGYRSLASTDMSAALTVGVAALIRGQYGRLTVAEVRQALEQGATVPRADRSGTGESAAAKPGWGHGALDAATALAAAGAIAAAHPAPKPPAPTSSAAARPARASTAAASTAAASARPDPGAQFRSILRDLVIAAGMLITAILGALTVARIRRRSRSARPPRGERPGHAARHARTPAVPRQPPGSLPRPGTSAGVFPAIAAPARGVGAIFAAPTIVAGRGAWETAPTTQPGQQAAETQLPPWEQSPSEFEIALLPPQAPPWPVSSTGPMYIWNPAERPPA